MFSHPGPPKAKWVLFSFPLGLSPGSKMRDISPCTTHSALSALPDSFLSHTLREPFLGDVWGGRGVLAHIFSYTFHQYYE